MISTRKIVVLRQDKISDLAGGRGTVVSNSNAPQIPVFITMYFITNPNAFNISPHMSTYQSQHDEFPSPKGPSSSSDFRDPSLQMSKTWTQSVELSGLSSKDRLTVQRIQSLSSKYSSCVVFVADPLI